MAIGTKWLVAKTVNEQENPNLALQFHWHNIVNATEDKYLYAYANYSRKGKKGEYTYTTPYIVTAHDFRIDESIVPKNAYITGVTIECCFKAEKGMRVKAPVAYFMIYKGTGKVTQAKPNKTGWHDSTYVVYPNTYIGASDTIVQYHISGTEWNKMKYPTKQLYNSVMGIDLKFQAPESMKTTVQSIFMKYARIKVAYEIPDYYLNWSSNLLDGDNPLNCKLGEQIKVCAEFGNRSHANGGTQTVDVNIPFGLEYEDATVSSNSRFEVVDSLKGEYKWICDGKGLSKNKLCLFLTPHTTGLKRIKANLGDVPYDGAYVYPYDFYDPEYTTGRVSSGDIRECRPSCFKFETKSYSTDDTVRYNIYVDSEGLVNHSDISEEVKQTYHNSGGANSNYLINWELSQESQTKGISIDDYSDNCIQFSIDRDVIPVGEEVEIVWTGCFVPMCSGNDTLVLTDIDTGDTISYPYYSIPFDGLELKRDYQSWEDLVWCDHRVLTELETEGYVLPCGVAQFDKVMFEGDCTLRAYFQKQVAYIGCVPVKHPHYEPDHDFDNDLVKNTYKNKTYAGKKQEFDEDTSLKIKLPPRDWTTIDGLAKLDKPVPVNLVPDAFEGDVLNHRGWVELYGTKGVKKTNPLYYDGEIKVFYLTHNINSRFEILKGKKTYEGTLPSLLAPVLESGEEFANYYFINEDGEEVSNGTGYFDVDTDGSYVYDEEAEENKRTLIAIDNSQFIRISSLNTLTEQSQISMEWNCSKIPENKENNIRRIISLMDSKGKAILEYEYSEFEYIEVDEFYTCKVVCRVLEGDEWVTKFTKDLNLAIDIESLQLYRNATGELVQRPEPTEEDYEGLDEDLIPDLYNDYMYGSTLHFSLNQNQLAITDEGYNGREVYEVIEIPQDSYKYCVEWKNNNTDGDDSEIITFFDFEVQESILTTDLADKYSKIMISSFPVADKKLLFMRNSQEGTLYYWEDDSKPFTYIQEPFYMYFCGVDLTASDGISIFDLNNSYSIFYMQNGLVRIGFNRLNGEIYISKYDLYSGQYLNVLQLQLTKYTDFQRGYYSDDKMEIKAGTTVFTMYRGHPYIVIEHKDEDILFETNFNKVWAESVDDEESLDFPALWSLVNDNNLLPKCVGGKNVSKSCIEFGEPYENPISVPTITLAKVTTDSYVGEDTIFSVASSITLGEGEGFSILVDGTETEVILAENGSIIEDTDGNPVKSKLVTTPQFSFRFNGIDAHTVQAVYKGNDTTGAGFSDRLTVETKQRNNQHDEPVGNYVLSIVKLPSTMTYMSDLDWRFKLTKGGNPIGGKTVEKITPRNIWSDTDYNKDGIYITQTAGHVDELKLWNVGEYTVGARFYHYDEPNDNKTIYCSVFKKLTITKGTPRLGWKELPKGTKGKVRFYLYYPKLSGIPDSQLGIPNAKLTIKVGGKTYYKTTNSYGMVELNRNTTKYHTFKVTFAGNKNLKKITKTFSS